MGPARRAVVSAAVVAGVAALYAARYWLTWDRFLGGHRDEALWLPLAMRVNDGTLFATDPLVGPLGRFFPRAWVTLSAAGLALVPDPGTFTLLASTLLLIVYAVGVCMLSLTVSGHGPAAVIIGITALRTNLDLSGIGWGIFVGNAEPRAFVHAAAPWIVTALVLTDMGGPERAPQAPRVARGAPGPLGRTWKYSQRLLGACTSLALALLGVVVGLLGDVHPVSALHLVALLIGAVVLTTPFAPGRALALAGGFAIGVSPYAVQWVGAYEPGAMAIDIFRFRNGAEFLPPWSDVVARAAGTLLVPLALAALALRVAPADTRHAGARAGLVRVGVVAVAGTLAAPLVPLLTPRLFALAPLRLSGYVYLVSLVLAGELLRRLLLAPRRRPVAAALLAVALVATAGGGRLGELARPHTLVRSGPTALWTDVTPAGGEPTADFLALCRWARAHTAPSDLFLTPPGGWASFRLYAARPLFVTFKDGGAVTMFSPRRAEEWYRRLRAEEELYVTFERDAVLVFARAHGIGYVVQERTRSAVDLPIAYENRTYRVYATDPGRATSRNW